MTNHDHVDDVESNARVLALKNLSQGKYNSLRRLVRRYVFPALADDAFAHALGVALDRYDGRVKLETYVLKVARNWAIGQTKAEPTQTISDLPEDRVEKLPAVDAQQSIPFGKFAEQVARLLETRQLFGDAKTARRNRLASQILQIFMQSTTANFGIGVDEYEKSGYTEQLCQLFNVKQWQQFERPLLEARLAQHLQVGPEELRQTMIVLRIAARDTLVRYADLLE